MIGQKKRKRAPELVHGLSETVELKDWDFAIIIAALKVYAEDARKRGLSHGAIMYSVNLRSRLRVPFVRLVKRTKRKHRDILAQIEHSKVLTDYCDS